MKISTVRLLCAVAVGPLLSVTYAPVAIAQTAAAGSVDELVVTARKREEKLQDIPESIAVVTSEALTRGGIATVDDLGRQTPGLVLNRRLDDTPNVVLRGVGSYGNVQGVGFYVDEVQNFTDQTMRLEDLESVEILKGPQGTLYGGSNIGGVIRYVSKRPTFEFSGAAKAEVGSREYRNLYGAINVPIIDDVIAIRGSAYWSHDRGYIYNANLGRPNGEREEYGFRGQLLISPNDRFTALFTVRHRNLDGSSFAYSRQSDVDRPLFDSYTTFVPNTTRKTWAGVANLTYDFGPAELVSITSFTRQSRTMLLDADYLPIARVAAIGFDTRPIEIYTQEIRLSSNGDGAFDWLVGLYGSRAENLMQNSPPYGVSIGGGPLIYPFVDRKTQQEDVAAFGTANMRFGALTVGAGLRLMHTKYAFTSLIDGAQPIIPALKLSTSDTALLPKFSVSYKLDSGTNIYASVARGYESGKVSVDAEPPFIFKPEKVWTFEVGAKGSIGPTIDFEAAAYYILYTNRQIETRVLNADGFVVERIDNVGDSVSKGIEANLRWRPIQGLDLTAAAGYLDAEWDDAQFGIADPTAPGGLRILQLKGDAVPNSPKWNLNFGASYSTPISDALVLDLHADTVYTGSLRWRIPPHPFSNFQRDYWVTNARIAIGAEDGRWQLAARVENLFDVRYFYEFAPQLFGPQQADGTCNLCHLGSPASPRRYVVSLSTRF